MKILDRLKKRAIIPGLKSQSKEGVLEELAKPLAEISHIPVEDLVQVLLEREHLGSTGIGGGVAIPHGKVKSLRSLLIAFGRSEKGIDFEAIDGKPTHIFFLIITPEDSTGMHLEILAKISKLLKDNTFKEELMAASDREEIYEIIKRVDEEF
nr:PTS sugar transporter subunit IIA [Desulfobacterales bacterium]